MNAIMILIAIVIRYINFSFIERKHVIHIRYIIAVLQN